MSESRGVSEQPVSEREPVSQGGDEEAGGEAGDEPESGTVSREQVRAV